MSTHLPAQSAMSSDPKKREQEVQKLLDEFDQRTGKVPRTTTPDPWNIERRFSKKTKDALDALEPKEQHESKFYKETPKMRKQQEAFDSAVKNASAPGTGTWQAGPVSKMDRLKAWHKAIGSPQHVVNAELKELEQQEKKA